MKLEPEPFDEWRHQRRVICAVLVGGPLGPKEARRLAGLHGVPKTRLRVGQLPVECYGRRWALSDQGRQWATRFRAVGRQLESRGWTVADACPGLAVWHYVAVHPDGRVRLIRLAREEDMESEDWDELVYFPCKRGWERIVYVYRDGKRIRIKL